MAEKGFIATTVSDIISRAKVSRTTFYQLFTDKLDCFLAANLTASEILVGHLEAELQRIDQAPNLSVQERFEQLLSSYLDSVAGLAGFAKVFLVEVYAAGAPAVAQRRDLLGAFIDLVVESNWGVTEGIITETELRAIAEVMVSALSLNVTTSLAVGDIDAIGKIKHSAAITIALLLPTASQ